MAADTAVAELMEWHHADQLPDADLTVLIEVRDPDEPETAEVWPGWWSGERWVDTAGWPIASTRVVAWADMPVGTMGVAV